MIIIPFQKQFPPLYMYFNYTYVLIQTQQIFNRDYFRNGKYIFKNSPEKYFQYFPANIETYEYGKIL